MGMADSIEGHADSIGYQLAVRLAHYRPSTINRHDEKIGLLSCGTTQGIDDEYTHIYTLSNVEQNKRFVASHSDRLAG
jgi:hypothetical protein